MRRLFELDNSALADFEITDIQINNLSSELSLICVDPTLQECKFVIGKVLSFSYEHKEPWGKGSYVASSFVEYRDATCKLIIELNSGDKIVVEFEQELS